MVRSRRFRASLLRLRRDGITVLGALLLLALAGITLYVLRPTALTVAVGPRDSAEAQLVEAYATLLSREKDGLKLTLTYQDDVGDAAGALESRGADLAVVRPDVRSPANGLTLAVLRDEALLLAAPEASGITDVAGLARKRLGLVVRHEADRPFVTQVLRHYDLAVEAGSGAGPGMGTVALVALKAEEVGAALSERRVDAVAVVATVNGTTAAAFVRAVEGASKDRKAVVLGVPEGDAIVGRLPEMQVVTIPAGAFGGRPKRPAEEVKTVGISYRLMARDDLRRESAAAVTQALFQKRGRLGGVATSLKAPDFDSAVTATSARLANHPGAVDYFQREQLTFMQSYGDWVYLAMFGAGSVGSALAWLAQRFARKRRELFDIVLDRLMAILGDARGCTEVAGLDALAQEIDELVIHAVRYARRRTTDVRTMSTLILAIDSARLAVGDRRRTLLGAEGDRDGDAAGRAAPGTRAAAE